MPKYKSLQRNIINVSEDTFEQVALEVFSYQYAHNPVYRSYVNYLGVDVEKINELTKIPFLPISIFKHQEVKTENWNAEMVFSSSGTTARQTSKHYIRDVDFYKTISKQIFESTYGQLSEFHILALLPSYLEREGSSLVYMIDHFIKETSSDFSAFYLHNQEELIATIEKLKSRDEKIILWGVSFALLELVEKYQLDFSGVIVMETGGMKGRRNELVREELHTILCAGFKVEVIHSEYGMTELMSQSYSKGAGIFDFSAQMRVLIRDINDPFDFYTECNKTGGINVIDLANLHSCAFIETQDLGLLRNKYTFEVIGRFDNSDIRGCNLLI